MSVSSQYTPPMLFNNGLVAHQMVVDAPCGMVLSEAITSGNIFPFSSQNPILINNSNGASLPNSVPAIEPGCTEYALTPNAFARLSNSSVNKLTAVFDCP